ncbi:hypothetical protein KFE25_011115 [Diacronema lutheri]|uniref:Kinesin motor domain-containing protein n=1 Tax=Diacronema lutheri TaxID=2081491 RepID=A0A8J6CD31_DIALT|nr:hypothetical protein KFE25_011115 [Diacronema lutheri]
MTQPLLGPSEAEAAEAGVTLSEPTGANAGRPPLAPRLSTGRAKPRSPAAAHGGLAAAAAAAEDAHGAGTRQMFDKRTLRREGASVFAAAIAQWLASPANEAVAAAADDYDGGGAGRAAPTGRATVRAYIRKRPLFDNERERGEFDVVSVARAPRAGGVPADTPPRALTVHLCLHEADLRTMFVRHVSHTAAAVFGESSTDEAVHAHAMAPLVSSAAAGGVGALFSFGQTGSGKTHTCDALERMASAQLFNELDKLGSSACVYVSYLELGGGKVLDLLSGPSKAECTLLDDHAGRTAIVGATHVRAHSADELLAIVHRGKAKRTTEQTAANATSSRSHAVLRIVIGPEIGADGGGDGGGDGGRNSGGDGGGDVGARAAANAVTVDGGSSGEGEGAARPAARAASPARRARASSVGRSRSPSPRKPGRAPSPAPGGGVGGTGTRNRAVGARRSTTLSGVGPSRYARLLPRAHDGQLLVVDCAGTERREDSAYHTAERRREGAEINSSLHALKECFRAMTNAHAQREGGGGGGAHGDGGRAGGAHAKPPRPRAASAGRRRASAGGGGGALRDYGRPAPARGRGAAAGGTAGGGSGGGGGGAHIPFRQALLTRVLSDAFTNARATVAVLGTLSPGASDTEHSLHTLQTVSAMASVDAFVREVRRDVGGGLGLPTPPPAHPKEWSRDEVCTWLGEADGGAFAHLAPALPAAMDGKLLTRMPKVQFAYRLCGGDERLGARLFDALRAQMEVAATLKARHAAAMRDLAGRR